VEHGHTVEQVRERISGTVRPDHLKDCVYGGVDGAVTTFAIVAGVQGAGLSPTIIIILGIANVIADGFSMAASNFSATKAELDDRTRLREIERRHIREDPEGEREETRQILRLKGLSEQTLEQAVDDISRNQGAWIEMMLVDEYGKAPTDPKPLASAVVTFISFLVCGLVPLSPFLMQVSDPFTVDIYATGLTFFAIGVMKSSWSLIKWWRSGLETLSIGAAAAALAYGAGYLVAQIAGS